MPSLTDLDKQHLWHPFTPMQAWCDEAHEPLVIVDGKGCLLRDAQGKEYLDGNASIWTNIHGHAHPTLNAAIAAQLQQVSHVSFPASW
jgi:adenosylmethionine---8-amino-7-oxononanoate aminotransferase